MHRDLFRDLAPPEASHYAGAYRGSDYRCLEFYRVRIPSDPRVGSPPAGVQQEMAELAQAIEESLSAVDAAHELPDGQIPRALKLYSVVVVSCRILEWFLRIHPYANGNGHIARIMVAILGRYGHWPRRWSVDPNPEGLLPYYAMITQHRSGNPVFCEERLLGDIA